MAIKLNKLHLKYASIVLASILLLTVIFVFGLYLSVLNGNFGELPTSEELKNYQGDYGSVVLSVDGVELGRIQQVNRSFSTFNEIPHQAIRALIATEDVRFFSHDGVDKRSLLRVLVRTILLGDRSAGGGSTITQQLVKNMFGRSSHGVLTIPIVKIREFIIASRLEDAFSKQEILLMYLNTVSFGENTYGIEAAAERFYSRSAHELSTEEVAVLIGMLKATTSYNPRLHPERSLSRRNVVLAQMEKAGFLSTSETDSLQQLPIKLEYNRRVEMGLADYFLQEVEYTALDLLKSVANNNWNLETDGLIIRTTLNAGLQEAALQSMLAHLAEMQPYLISEYQRGQKKRQLDSLARKLVQQSEADTATIRNIFRWPYEQATALTITDSVKRVLLQLHAGVLGIDPATGAVKCYVGGIDFASNPYNQVKARRQMASSFKPILYAAALSADKEPCDYIENRAFTLTDYEEWRPENYDEEVGGKYTLTGALALSKNIPTVRLLFETGFERVDSIWQSLGFERDMEYNPSLALGTIDASLEEAVRAYAAFANGGKHVNPYMIESIETKDGEILYQHERIESRQVLDEKVANQIAAMLQVAVDQGTGAALRTRHGLDLPLAGKTGTSQNYADAWFIGFNPAIVIATRVGTSLPLIHFSSGQYGSGSSLALPIVGKTLQEALRDNKTQELIDRAFSAEASPKSWTDCALYVDNTGFEKFINIFKSEETTLEKEKRRAKRRQFFRDLFKGDDDG